LITLQYKHIDKCSFIQEPSVPDTQLPGRQQHHVEPLEQVADPHQQADTSSYHIRRKGSRYNIQGPQGRIFSKYKSASVAGPRWEELTHTPWPYPSSAYESGLRLWELGLIPREQVGQIGLPDEPSYTTHQEDSPPSTLFREHTPPNPERKKPLSARSLQPATTPSQQIAISTQPVSSPIPSKQYAEIPALPAPRIDLEKQDRMIQMLRQDPRLLFAPRIHQALHIEIEYHRPYARRAETLLKLLAKYQARQRQRGGRPEAVEPNEILARHLAWQEQQSKGVATASSPA
jgi:hypothetical protein